MRTIKKLASVLQLRSEPEHRDNLPPSAQRAVPLTKWRQILNLVEQDDLMLFFVIGVDLDGVDTLFIPN
jgi:hypothetical protein